MSRRVFICCFAIWFLAFTLSSAQERQPRRAANQQADGADEPIDYQKVRELRTKKKGGQELTAAEEALVRRAMAARQSEPGHTGLTPREKTGLKPLSEMSATDKYQGEDGGLYGQGRNNPPDEHRQAALAQAKQIQPLDDQGKPTADGTIAFISISMSNATQEFSTFKKLADADPNRSPQVAVVDCAQGGQAMAEWVSPEAEPWKVAERRLNMAKITPAQVQVAWIKLANKLPRGTLEEHGKKLQRDTLAVVHNAKTKFPNLRIVYLGSRTYGGYSGGALNPEPYAYESAFVCRWLIQDQIKRDPALNYEESRGAVKAPLLLWGPYFWADGVTPRQNDQLSWTRTDFGPDGVHPSQIGRDKVAKMLLDFVRTNETAKLWYTK